MIFEILAERNAKDQKTFFYDNVTNTLKDSDGNVFEYPKEQQKKYTKKAITFSKDEPLKKSRKVRMVKIQLGLSCNYSCSYCSQRFVERPPETNKKDIENFMELFDNLEFSEKDGLKIEIWGGEPFVYWKTFKPLVEAIAEKFSHWEKPPRFSVITNGSILTKEICAWLMYMGFSVGMSHDGPGQFVRGPDPLEDPEKKKIILDFYKKMKPQGKMSFNSMLHNKNRSRKAVYDYFVELTGDPDVRLGEGGIVDAYDEDGIENSLQTKADHFDYRRTAFSDIRNTQGKIGFVGILDKVDSFIKDVLSHKNADTTPQKCGMDNPEILAIDMRGNVITCQNVSAAETAMNGEKHLVGNLADFDNVEIKSATHWSNRQDCADCPALHICKGACMFLDGKFWESSCNNAYSDTISLFALAFEKITGYIPVYINNDHLPPERRDIWGTVLKHEEKPKKKVIPIKIVSEKTMVVEGVEVFEKAKITEINEG